MLLKKNLLLVLCGLVFAVSAFAGDPDYYYSSLKIVPAGVTTGAGSVYVANANTKPGTANPNTAVKSAATETSGGSTTMYYWIDVNPGYNVSSTGQVVFDYLTAASKTGSVACAASTTANGTKAYTATATFVAVKVNSVTPTSISLDPTNPSADYPFTVTFFTSYMKTLAIDFTNLPASADGKFTITNWGVDGNNVVATGKFNGGGTYGGASRNNSTTISLQSKAAGSTAVKCTVTANFPAIEFVGAEATDVFTTTTDATKTGTATYTFKYAAGDDFPTTPTIVHTSGSGAFAVTGYTVTPNFSTGVTTVTVNYSFNPNGEAGITKEQLRLTSVAGTNYDVTLTATAEAEATDDAKVIAADGTTLIYQGDWATALTKANTNAGCTLQLLRNVDLGTLAAVQSVTNTFTLDLNGKILSGTVSSAVIQLLYINKAGKTLTILDSKTGGKISATGTYTNALCCINVNNGNVILNSGSIEITNTNTSQTTADRLYATGVFVNSGKTFTMNGGSITATRKARDAYGVYVAANATSRGKATINNGTITANGNTYAYGIRGYGDIIINGGTIHAETLTGDYAYGVNLRAYANATATSGYYGKLTMSGGVIESVTKKANAYGIFADRSRAGTGAALAVDGTHSNQETGQITITGGTIKAKPTTSNAFGVAAYGSFSSKDNKHITHIVKNATIEATATSGAYGVYGFAEVNGTYGTCHSSDFTLTDCNVTVQTTTSTTAYAVWTTAAANTVYKNAQPNYFGEYACGSKMTINSGTYKATTKTYNCYAVGTSARAKTTYGSESNVTAERTLGGNAEAVATLIIKGGTFEAHSGSYNARALSNGGNCTITGGEFKATSGTYGAYGLYTVSGKLKASSVPVTANAGTKNAYGIMVDAANVPTGDAAWTGFNYAGDAELNNLDVNVSTGTAEGAYGVYVNATQYRYTQSAFDTYMQGRVEAGKVTQANYDIFAAIFPGDNKSYAIAGKAVVNGGTYTVNAATTTAWGIHAVNRVVSADKSASAAPELTINNVTLDVKTNGTTTAGGIRTGGPTTIDKTNITVSSKTSTCYGLLIGSDTTTMTNTTIDARGTATVYGIYANSASSTTHGYDWHGNAKLGKGNDVTAAATSGNTSYGVYLHATKAAVASGDFAGNYANAAEATITDGKYKATATGTTAYAICLAAQTKQGDEFGRPKCHVTGGKFWGDATGGTDGCVNTSGQMGYFVLGGGYYNVNTNLATYVEEGKNINDVVSPSPEYTEGYRYYISSAASGAVVCRVYQNGTTDVGGYKTLKEALQFVNANSGTNYTIVMVGNHTLPKGNYILPAKATLVVPESLTRKSGMGTRPIRDENVSTPKPVQFLMLTLDKGVNMTVYGGIETSAHQNSAGGGQPITGAPHGNYGRLHLVEGSKITLESGSNLNCWGYTTGKGEITAMSGSTVREGFQLGYWRGGSATYDMLSNKASWKAFPVTDYFIQNVEAPIMFRPGSTLYGYSGVHTGFGDYTADDIKLVGTSGAMFLLDNADASADTWVKKEYDPATDRAVWTVNSGAKLGQFSFELAGYGINSADYYLPVSNNMTIYINEGEFIVTQDALLIPGAQIIISKLGKLTVASGKRLFVMDNEDWPGFYKTDNTTFARWYYNATYSPSWTTNPRTTLYPPTTKPLPDAEIFVHGTTEGQYYTTTHGANIHSTNADAGVVRFIANAGANTSIQHVVNTECDRRTLNFTSAQLKNEDTSYPYTSSVGTVAGEAFTYMDNMWVKTRENGCLLERTDGTGTHQLAHPSDVVAVVPNDGDNAYHSETGSRNFVFAEKKVTTAGCTWWEAEKVTSGTYAGDYMANQDRYDNYGGYFYWDASAGYWKPRYVTVKWQNYDGTTLATYTNVQYNTSPKYTGTTPKVPATTSTASYAWTGWKNMTTGVEYDRDETLPRVDGNVTYKAVVPETKFEYLITFKNDAGKVIHTEMFEAGSTPECPPEKVVKASTASQDFTFSSWSPAITTVTGSATYTAIFTPSPRKYTVTFVDYDNTFLADTLINYNDLAVYPALAEEPYRESTDAFSYDWIGWTKALAKVTKDVTYVAKYKQTTLKYKVIFKSDCWGQNDGADGCVEKIHKTTEYALGANPAVPANPARPATAQYTFTFDHWDPAVAPVEVGGATYTAVYNKTPRSYAINYRDKNNAVFTGTHTASYPTTHTYLTAETLDVPTRTGYTFEGWYIDKECAVTKVTKMPAEIVAATTLYANWTPNTNTEYTVEHCRQALDGTYPDALKETENKTGTTATSVTPDRKEYTGFKTPAAQTKTILADGSLVITYLYTRNSFRLTWNLGGGTVSVAGTGAAVDAIGSPYSNVLFENAISVPTVTRTGYTFAGWDNTPATKMPAAATTYVAQWTPITYNITYKDQGGVAFTGVHADDAPTTHTYATATALKDPKKVGYTFGGWFIAEDCSGTKLTTLAAAGYTADITLYAKWTINTRKLTWNWGGGATSSATHTAAGNVTYGTAIVYPADNTMTRANYAFSGWDKSNTTMPDENLTITAQWTAAVASVTVGGTTTYYATIAEAWAFVQEQTENTTLKLLQDVTSTASLVFTPAAAITCTFDLNNHTLSGAVDKLININLAGSTFVIDDSSNDKNGKILAEYSVNDRLYAIFLTAGTLNLKAGHIHSKNPHTYSSAAANKNSAATGLYVTLGQTFTMDGGTVESESQYNSIAIFASESGTTPISINGGRVYAYTTASTTAIGIYTYAKDLEVNGGTIIGHAYTSTAYGIYVRGGSATLNGGRIEATNDDTHGTTTCYGIYARGPITIPATSTVDVFAQARTNTAYAVDVYAGITGNTIAGGTFTANAKTGKTAAGIYSAGNITVSGGTFTATTNTTGAYGIYSVRGTATVNGDPIFNATAGSSTAYGTYAYGTIGANGKDKYSGTIKINGGTFNVTSTKETAYGAYAALIGKTIKETSDGTDTIAGTHYMPGIISITDGTFNVKAKTTAAGGIVVAAAKSESGAVGTTSRIPKATVTGGNFKVESAGDANATAYAMNTLATATNLVVQGGKYNTKKTGASTNIESKYTAPTKDCNYHVIPLIGEDPYKYEVAEAYTVTFKNGDDVLQSGVVKKGTTPTYSGEEPTKASDAEFSYTFDGWDKALVAVTGAVTYNATFASTTNKYTITFIDGDGNTLTNTPADNKWNYGTKPTYTGSTPTKTASSTYTYTFNGSWSDGVNVYTTAELPNVTGDKTYTAQFNANPKDLGNYMDIIDWNGTTVTLNMNGYVGSGSGAARSGWKVSANDGTNTTSTYTVSNAVKQILTLDISGLSASANDEIYIQGLSSTDGLDSYHSYRVPVVYNASANLSGTTTESIVLVRQGTLTVTSNTTVKALYVYPGAELVINSGVKLTVSDKVVLRTVGNTDSKQLPNFNGGVSAGLTNNGTLACDNVYYTRISTENQKALQIGFPFDVDLTKVVTSSPSLNARYASAGLKAYGTLFGIMRYDAASRAENGIGGNWKGLNPSSETTLSANTGYQILAASDFYYEFYFPVEYSRTDAGKTIAVLANKSDSTNVLDQGWNYVTSPYTQPFVIRPSDSPEYNFKMTELVLFNGMSGDEVFVQYEPTDEKPLTLKPASPFYLQVSGAGSYTINNDGTSFNAGNAGPNGAPARKPQASVQTQWIKLYYGNIDAEDQTTIYLNNKFSAEYETGFDVVKYSKTSSIPTVYSSLACGDLAFTALPDSVASRERIPLTVFAPHAGEMYFSIAGNAFMDRLESVLLVDTHDGTTTDLLFGDYYYYAEQGTQKGRFYLQPVFRAPKVATDADAQDESGALIHTDGNSITVSGLTDGAKVLCYDVVGHLIAQYNNAEQTVTLQVPATGVYFIQVGKQVTKVVIK